jgi:aconitate hydratase
MMPFLLLLVLKAAGVASIVVGDHNYGEGSSREHAAMETSFPWVKPYWLNHLLVSTNLKNKVVRIDIR